MNICTACNGLGSYEFWGTYYRCHVCGGTGVDPDAPDEDWEEEEEPEAATSGPEEKEKEDEHHAN